MQIKNVGTARLEWVDGLKAILIFTMVLCHVGTWPQLDRYIHAFHMPLFFVLSGYTYDPEKTRAFWPYLKKKFRTLLVPYLFFGTVLFFFWNAALYVLGREEEMRTVGNLLASLLWINSNTQTFGVVQWFLTCMFLSSILFYGIWHAACGEKKRVCAYLIVLSLLGYLYPLVFDFRLPWSMDTALTATVFYGIGWLFRGYRHPDDALHSPLEKWIVFAGGGMFLGISAVFFNSNTNMRMMHYGNYLLYYANAVGFWLWFSALARSITRLPGKGRWYALLLKVGRSTLVILLLNSTAVRAWEVVRPGVISRLPQWQQYLIHIPVTLVLTLGCTLCAHILERFAPELVGRSRSKR